MVDVKSIKHLVKCALGVMRRRSAKRIAAAREGLTVFTFHEVCDQPSPFLRMNGLSTPRHLFQKQIDWIASRYNVVDPTHLDREDLPSNAALITFDDGWAGACEFALPYLNERELHSLMFLNMGFVLDQYLLPPLMNYHQECRLGMINATAADGYLSITPGVFEESGYARRVVEDPRFAQYQGRAATQASLMQLDTSEYVHWGNHLYQHWNAAILTPSEFSFEVARNTEAMFFLKSVLPYFSIPHGRMDICFSQSHAELLNDLGYSKIFSNMGSLNRHVNTHILDRINISSQVSNAMVFDYVALN